MKRLGIIAGLLVVVAPVAAVRGQERALGSPSASGYSQGWSLDRRPIVPVTDYAASTYYPGGLGSLADPIFMTTLNTPGVYGAYDFGNGGLSLTREPFFYPRLSDRERIPAITTTITPFRDANTPAGAPSLYAGPPSVTPAVPGSATVRTLPEQILTARALATTAQPLLTATTRPDQTARVVVRLPEDARLDFQGVSMPLLGRVRKFDTPPLVPGRKYLYDVRASWNEDGKPVTRQRQVAVYGGERTDVDFLDGTEQHTVRELHAQPLRPLTAPPAVVPPAPVPPPAATPAPPAAATPVPPAVTPPAVVHPPAADVLPRVTPPPAPGQKPDLVPPMQPTLPPNRR